jgi:F0F1-type ATP synthase assembly protein I
MAEEKTKDDKNMGALFIPAGILIGMGIGFLTGNLPAWLFIGLGVGFLGFGITYIVKKK